MAIQIEYKCTKQTLERTCADKTIAALASGYDFAHFEFCPDWDGLNKTVSFEGTDGRQFLVLPDENNIALIPVAAIKPGGFWVSVFGSDGKGERITSTRDFITVLKSALKDDNYPPPPEPSIYDKLHQTIVDIHDAEYTAGENAAKAAASAEEAQGIAQSVRDDADAGKFKGDKGERGEKGDRGSDGTGITTKLDPGFFTMSVEPDGHLYVTHNSNETAPPLSIKNGKLIYTVE